MDKNDSIASEVDLAVFMQYLRERHSYLTGLGAKETYEGTGHTVIESQAKRIAELERKIVEYQRVIHGYAPPPNDELVCLALDAPLGLRRPHDFDPGMSAENLSAEARDAGQRVADRPSLRGRRLWVGEMLVDGIPVDKREHQLPVKKPALTPSQAAVMQGLSDDPHEVYGTCGYCQTRGVKRGFQRTCCSAGAACDQRLGLAPETNDGYYVEELHAGHWRRCALGHMWGSETDARTQLEELRRRYGGRVFRLHGDAESESAIREKHAHDARDEPRPRAADDVAADAAGENRHKPL